MIKKIISIKNVGKFTTYNAAGDVEFRKLTLVYAENGRGKTTLCDILRSLQTGGGDHIAGRQTLGSADTPEVCIRLENRNTNFRDGAWTSTCPEIVIFDSSFVHSNVYAGDYVDHEHKKNLYRVIVGEEGVQIAEAVDALDRRIRDVNREIAEKKVAVQSLTPSGYTVDTFLAIPADAEIEQKVRNQEQILKALEQADDIRARESLKQISLPRLPHHTAEVLAKQLDDVSEAADERVREHIQAHLDDRGEGWLEQGIGYVTNDSCGFCGQRLEGIELIQAYREYFSKAYGDLKTEVSALANTIRELLGERALLRLQGDLITNESNAGFWGEFVEVNVAHLPFDDLRPILETLRQEALRLADEKLGRPLESVTLDEGFQEALREYEEIERQVADINVSIAATNERIEAKRAATRAGNLEEARGALGRQKAAKQRYETQADEACRAYEVAVESKRNLEEQKRLTKQRLDEYSERIFEQYQRRINQLLGLFGAGFTIGDSKGQYRGGTASSSYRIVINETPVELGDSDTPVGVPSFRNTLSSGDRSTLGLAFFLAQLDHDQAIAERVIIFDDPFTSQDRFRRTCTQQLICKQYERANQVIVLSHDPSFLKLLWDHVAADSVKTLQMPRAGKYTVINEWDIEAETRPGYFQDHEALVLFDRDGSGEPRDVVRCIRPVLEGFLRFRFPGHFAAKEWLGDFIDKIQACDQTSSLFPVRSIVEEISNINDYSKKYHHEQNPAGADTEPIDDGELQAWVKRTLSLVGGY